MALTFNGYTITGGVTPLFGATGGSHASVGGVKCTLKNESGVGFSFDPFSIEIPCNCAPQAGDTIEVTARTILVVDVTTVRWNLCGGECRGETTDPGFAVGLEIKSLKWVV
ncbi:MAG: hypothetical protein QOH93_1783 [Chloroflexia bacterium]|jgi:hypothetical protein|nr:hypothetical protein [Chloroflexia bacterium]